jgi:seryl-tRNA synthetase
MGELLLALPSAAIGKHMEYAAWFTDEHLERVELRDGQLVVGFGAGVTEDALRAKLDRLVARFVQMADFEARELFRTPGAAVGGDPCDPYNELLARGWVVELGRGQVALRGLALELLEFLDEAFVRRVGGPASARPEYYPSVMTTERVNRCNHFGSFPEHVHFVTHLREDLDVLDDFARELRAAGGWTPEVLGKLERPMASPAIVLNPSVCYNCYASLENTTITGDGFVVTARSRCHRYESGNHRTLSRLMDFSMREVIYVGSPDFVKRERDRSIELTRGLVEHWGLASWMETANDPFFTNDFEVKAKFQRQNDMKYELRMPLATGSVAVASSNFHAVTFGKAFNIQRVPEGAPHGAQGRGLERWIYAVFSQVGLEPASWPAGLRADFESWQARHG